MSDFQEPIYLFAITPEGEQSLFRTYRDYLVFLSLCRDMVRIGNHRIYGFTWLKEKAYLLCHSRDEYRAEPVLKLMQRYYYWLQVGGQSNHRYKLQMNRLCGREELLEALKYIHCQVLHYREITDPLAYHWHSYPVYHDYWQLDWLGSESMLAMYSTNKVIAMQRFREHMLKPEHINFTYRLRADNEVTRQVSPNRANASPPSYQIASPLSDYHQRYYQGISCELLSEGNELLVTIRQITM